MRTPTPAYAPLYAGPVLPAIGIVLAVLLSFGGCSDPYADATKDPVADLKNKDLQLNQRQEAIERLWTDVQAGKTDPKVGREALKDLIWKGGAPTPLRQRALALLLTDTSPGAVGDTRNLLRLRLPTETAWPLIVDIAKAAQDRAGEPEWKDQTASLVRSYSRRVPEPPDGARPERAALLALHPGRSIEEIAFDVFLHPAANGAPPRPEDSARKSSQAAWELLSRLDPDGSKREALVSSRAPSPAEPALKEVGKAAADLGVIPVSASELSWVRALLDDKDQRSVTWWSAATAAVHSLSPSQHQGLQLRHIEPIRWAASHRPELLLADRDGLMLQLEKRLKDGAGRKIHRKTEGLGSRGMVSKETPREWDTSLAWGDLLAILIIDEALRAPAVTTELFKQAAADEADASTEYGGVLWSTDQYGQGANTSPGHEATAPFLVRGYQPRPAQRANDRTFIAPEEMFSDSPRSFAHYHFHVQTPSNAEYAGPGQGDLEYADAHGRSCVVLTSVKEGVLGVDYYQRNGAVIDLGEIARPK